jgi:hypothetical protein
MKRLILLMILLIVELCYAQLIPYKATIIPSKEAVLSSETITVTYTLTEVEGYVYIGVQDGYFDIIGKDRWEGYIKYGESANVSFTIKFKEKIKPYLYGDNVSLSIGFSFYPFGEAVIGGAFETILIKLSDLDDFDKKERELKDSTDQGNGSSLRLDLHLIPYNTEMPELLDEVTPDTSNIRLY